jgi:uncharacterized membrane protein YsdA (DUF1294 family)
MGTNKNPARSKGTFWRNPYRRFGWLSALGVLILWGILKYLFRGLDWLVGLLIALNFVTFSAYGYDKAVAGSDRTRIPERVLLGLAFAGGSIAAITGMWLFRHKTASKAFRLKFVAVVVLQIALVGCYVWWRWFSG